MRWKYLFGVLLVAALIYFQLFLFRAQPDDKVVVKTTTEPEQQRHETNHSNIDDGRLHQDQDLLWQRHHNQAKVAFRDMHRQRVFDTQVSWTKGVLKRGFPVVWTRCTLGNRTISEKLMISNSTPKLGIVILGGSASSRPGDNCTVSGYGRGRYSDLLQKGLDIGMNQTMQVKVSNMAQGTTGSVDSGLLLDELVDVDTTDVLIWEYLINDHQGSFQEKRRKLDFWLTRVHAHFSQSGKSPPPIILVALWGYKAAEVETETVLNKGLFLNERPMDYFGDLISTYRSLGWEIALLNVAAATDPKLVAKGVDVLFDDAHHPSCIGVQLIANMIQHLVYSDIASCSSSFPNNPQSTQHNEIATPPHTDLLGDISSEWQNLWTDLFREDVRIGTLTPWEPNIGRTGLAIGNWEQVKKFTTIKMAKSVASRKDRKNGYLIPACSNDGPTEPLIFILQEPTLTWLGLGHDYAGLQVVVNGRKLEVPDNETWNLAKVYIRKWVHLPDHIAKSTEYKIELCQDNTQKQLGLRQLIGVMLPP